MVTPAILVIEVDEGGPSPRRADRAGDPGCDERRWAGDRRQCAGPHLGDAPSAPDEYLGDPAAQAEWDRRYADRQQLWSGHPNGVLVAEVSGLTPGRVLDVGCGEGAYAVWLARGGWDVTGLEVSGLALQRAARHARDAGVTIRWVHAGLAEAAIPPASFDMVCALYPALLRTPDGAAERALLSAIAPGDMLLLVHHAGMETQRTPGRLRPRPLRLALGDRRAAQRRLAGAAGRAAAAHRTRRRGRRPPHRRPRTACSPSALRRLRGQPPRL